MAAVNGNDTQALQAVAVPEGQDRIFQTMTGKKKTLKDRGLVKIVVAYGDQDTLRSLVHVIEPETLDKITNILEDEAIG